MSWAGSVPGKGRSAPARLGGSQVSPADRFRSEIAGRIPLGQEHERCVAAGNLVPDDVVLDVVATNLASSAARSHGYLLDGFPRMLAQGQALFEVLGAGVIDRRCVTCGGRLQRRSDDLAW